MDSDEELRSPPRALYGRNISTVVAISPVAKANHPFDNGRFIIIEVYYLFLAFLSAGQFNTESALLKLR